ncbi:hypothetical protein, partial [Paraburkholderia caribensis]|uniref:hypothetical protein n=1 Tax=Paraburkholderia caribensis TaxID=75105 RepID=UPI00286B9B26
MIVRIARVKVGNRQAPYPRQDPALKSGVLAFGARNLRLRVASAACLCAGIRDRPSRNERFRDIPSFPLAKRTLTPGVICVASQHPLLHLTASAVLLMGLRQHIDPFHFRPLGMLISSTISDRRFVNLR